MPRKKAPKKLDIARFKTSPRGIMEFARILDTAPPELRQKILKQAEKEDPEFLDGVLRHTGAEDSTSGLENAQELKLERFKKSTEGVIDFAKLLEQSSPKTRQLILDRVESQDPDFGRIVLKKTVFFEELIYIDEGILAEILGDTPAKTLSYALWRMDDNFRNIILKNVGHRTQKQVQEEQEEFGGKGLAEGLVLGARRQILKIARNLEAKDKFIFELSKCPRFEEMGLLDDDDDEYEEEDEAVA